jgi:hypothetical protein
VGATTLGTQLNDWYDKMAAWVGDAKTKIPAAS